MQKRLDQQRLGESGSASQTAGSMATTATQRPAPANSGPEATKFLTSARYARDMFTFARYLGVDPVKETHLLWIAEECMLCPLPPDFTEHLDEAQRPYWYCAATDESTRVHPLDGYYQSLVAHERRVHLAAKRKGHRSSGGGAGGANGAGGAGGAPGAGGARSPSPERKPGAKKERKPVEVGTAEPVVYETGRGGKKVLVEPPPITPYELLAMAKYLRIDPLKEFHLLWIAEEALKTPLPPNVEEYVDEQGWPFYYDVERDEAAREHPRDDYYAGLVASERERKLTRRDLRELDLDIVKPWMKFTGQMGNAYYYNFVTRMTSAHLPGSPELEMSASRQPIFRFSMMSPEGLDVKR